MPAPRISLNLQAWVAKMLIFSVLVVAVLPASTDISSMIDCDDQLARQPLPDKSPVRFNVSRLSKAENNCLF